MANTIRLKRGTTTPTSQALVTGELAVNTTDGSVYTLTDTGSVVRVGGTSGGTWGSITGTLSSQTDLNTALGAKADLASPTFTGTPTLPTGTIGVTQTAGNSTTALATTAFVTTANNLKANLASPTFTGTPAAPTASAGTNTTQLATTAFVTTAVSTKANLASPALTGTPTAPTAASATNSTQIATTAYVKTNLASYAPLASPTFTGNPGAPTAATTNDGTLIANTAFVKANIRRLPTYFNGDLTSTSSFVENNAYFSNNNAGHQIILPYYGYYNADGAVVMFKQHDNSQMNFNDGYGWTMAPNGDRYYAAFPNAVVFAVKISTYSWYVFGDLTSTQYQAYGTVLTSAAVDTGNTVSSNLYDYYGNTINAYTYYAVWANGWGGQFNHYENAPYGTVMSDYFTYSNSTDTYNLAADGYGGYYYNFISSSGGGGYDAYGTKYGTPFWDGMGLLQNIADGNGGSTNISWDGNSPYPSYGTQISTTYTNQYGTQYDGLGNGWTVIYDSTQYADGNNGSYTSWTISNGYYYPSGWAFDYYHVDSSRYNYNTYFYDSSYTSIYPWDYGYNSADGMGNTQWSSTSSSNAWHPSYGTQLSNYFTDQNWNYGFIAADGNNGYYFQT